MNGSVVARAWPAKRRASRALVVLVAAAVAALAGVTPASAGPTTGSISGTVTGPDGPVEGVWVSAGAIAGPIGETRVQTGADGTYQISGLAPAEYLVQFDGSALGLAGEFYNDAPTLNDATPVTVTAGADTGGIDAALVLGGSISGTVSVPAGVPVVGLNVCAHPVGSMGLNCVETGADGAYEIVALAEHDYIVHFDGSWFGLVGEWWNNALWEEDATPVSVTSGVVTSGINAALVLGHSISGTVTGPGGGPVEGVRVLAWSGSVGNSARTAADGTYEIRGFSPGDYQVEFDGSDVGLSREYWNDTLLWDDATQVTVTANADTSGINAALVLGGSISGTVTGPDRPGPSPSPRSTHREREPR